jgi:integrase
VDLNTAIAEFNTYRAGTGFSKNTVAVGKKALTHFMAVTGNIQCKSLGPHHGEMFLSWMLGRGYKPRSINLYISCLSMFVKWAAQRRLMNANQNVLGTIRYQSVVDEPRRRVPAHDFPRLLDAATDPQGRIIVALGLYLFLRSSEIVGLRLRDLELENGLIRVYQPKTKRWDEMPVCAELDEELRAWLTFYATDQPGPLEPDYYLVPARRKRPINAPTGGVDLAPTNRLTNTSRKIHAALRGIGWVVEGEDAEGVHTLRRSGARAWFDELVAQGRDGALRLVSSMLHHKSVTQTELYLGLDVDREKRDVHLRGERMFTQPDRENVVTLKEVSR